MIIRENKTYDQEFGDIKGGNGDPNLVMYGEKNTPNSHAMAKRWSLLDNYFTDTEVSITGHFYLNAGQLTDYAEKNLVQRFDVVRFMAVTRSRSRLCKRFFPSLRLSCRSSD